MAECWICIALVRNSETGETRDQGRERSFPAALGAKLVRRGDWRKVRVENDGRDEAEGIVWTEKGGFTPDMPKPRSTKGLVPPGAVLNG